MTQIFLIYKIIIKKKESNFPNISPANKSITLRGWFFVTSDSKLERSVPFKKKKIARGSSSSGKVFESFSPGVSLDTRRRFLERISTICLWITSWRCIDLVTNATVNRRMERDDERHRFNLWTNVIDCQPVAVSFDRRSANRYRWIRGISTEFACNVNKWK